MLVIRAVFLPALVAVLFLTGSGEVVGQDLSSMSGASGYLHERDAPVARAVRLTAPLSIDGRLDESVWMTAPPISDFRQTVPDEGQPVTERTEIRFLYDDDHLYVGAWLWDRGEVLSRLARRDA